MAAVRWWAEGDTSKHRESLLILKALYSVWTSVLGAATWIHVLLQI